MRAAAAAIIAPTLGLVADHAPHMKLDFSPFVFLAGGAALLIAGPALRLRDEAAT
jgi:hypothetical protein